MKSCWLVGVADALCLSWRADGSTHTPCSASPSLECPVQLKERHGVTLATNLCVWKSNSLPQPRYHHKLPWCIKEQRVGKTSPSGIWSFCNDTEKFSMAPALRMTCSNKLKLPFFWCFVWLRVRNCLQAYHHPASYLLVSFTMVRMGRSAWTCKRSDTLSSCH
jgi:hypothetical protein